MVPIPHYIIFTIIVVLDTIGMKLLKEILIVEDDEIIASLIEKILRKKDYLVTGIAKSGEDALAMVAEHFPDLVLMDIGLKGSIDGIYAARYIYNVFNTPVLFISGQISDEIFYRVKYSDCYGFITKPFNDKAMLANVEIAIHNHELKKKLLNREENPLRSIMSVLDGILITDKKGRILFMNPFAEHLIGVDRRNAILKPLNRLMILMDVRKGEKIEDPVNEVVRESMVIGIEGNLALVTNGGRRKNITLRAYPLTDHWNEMIGVFIRIHELSPTERKLADPAGL